MGEAKGFVIRSCGCESRRGRDFLTNFPKLLHSWFKKLKKNKPIAATLLNQPEKPELIICVGPSTKMSKTFPQIDI